MLFTTTRRALVLGVAFACAPATAGAATRDVAMGTPPSASKTMQKLSADANAFFPSRTTIAAGDKVRFSPFGFHNVHLFARGSKPTPLFVPTGDSAAAKDAAGQDFWFNGNPVMALNPALMKLAYGKSFSFDGTKDVQSGLPLGDKLKPMTVRFTKAGTYTYVCEVHPGMKGTVKVVKRRAGARSAKAHKRAAAAQVAAAVDEARNLDKSSVADDTIALGSVGEGGVEYLGFLPAEKTVSPGTTLKFAMPEGSFEAHTATTGPGDPLKGEGYLGALSKSFESPAVDPIALYMSDAPTSVANLSPTLHGNGFWNSGVLDPFDESPLPPVAQVKFGTAGTYTFYCLIHPFMKGTVTVK